MGRPNQGLRRDELKEYQFAIVVILMFMLMLGMVVAVGAQTKYVFVIGAVADDGSKGNIGVRGEIRTHLFNVSSEEIDYFYIAESFSDRSITTFGYVSDWVTGEWKLHWGFGTPAGQSNFEYGPIASTGPNGTWHEYAIMHESDTLWNFTFDGHLVGVMPIPLAVPDAPVFLSAEKITFDRSERPLGPVEFRNLSYLKSDGWHPVASLRAEVFCQVIEDTNTQCNLDVPYGILALGPNHILVGSGVPTYKDGEMLWASNPFYYSTPYLLSLVLIGALSACIYWVLRKRRATN